MRTIYIGAGSNLEPRRNVAQALRLLSKNQMIAGISTVYRTNPELNRKQPDYYNCVIAVRTDLSPKELKHNLLRKIEGLLGRKREKDRYASRTIDLDVIAYDGQKTETAGLTLPDPEIRRRPYLAAGLRELGYRTEGKRDVEYRTGEYAGIRRRMRPLPGYTGYLRKELIKWNRICRKSKI